MPTIKTNPAKATTKQQEYISILLIDLGLDKKRGNAHIQSIINRKVEYLDELYVFEASKIITRFKEWKENKGVSKTDSI